MKIEFPKIIRAVDLGEYAPEVKGVIQVWVNPPMKLLQDLGDLYRQADKQDEFLVLLSELLSQGDITATVDNLKKIMEDCADTDPAFWVWMENRIVQEISDHRNGRKKALAPPPPS